jgi:AraC family transcriptional regulator
MQVFKQGKYSGNVIWARGKEGVIACVTAYNEHDFNDSLHCHNNTHFSFALEGGCVEKKKDAYEITPGNITYYSAGEQHQVLKIAKPSRRINIELEESFFNPFQISDGVVRSAIIKNPDAKFLMVKMYKELLANEDFSEASTQMLLLQLI